MKLWVVSEMVGYSNDGVYPVAVFETEDAAECYMKESGNYYNMFTTELELGLVLKQESNP